MAAQMDQVEMATVIDENSKPEVNVTDIDAKTQNTSTSKSEEQKYKAISVKGKRIIFVEKSLELYSHPCTISGLYKFHTFVKTKLKQNDECVANTGDDKEKQGISLRDCDMALVCNLVQDSRLALDELCAKITKHLFPRGLFYNEEGKMSEVKVEMDNIKENILKVAERINYGIEDNLDSEADGTAPHEFVNPDIWRWEVKDLGMFSKDIQHDLLERRKKRNQAKEDCRLLVGRSEVKQQRVDGETLEIQEEKSSELEKTEERMDDAIEQSIEQSIEHDSTGQGKRQTLLNVFFGSRALKGNRGGGVTLGKPVERFRDFFIKPNVVMGNGSKFLSEEKKKQIVNRMDLELNQPTELTNEQIIYELKQIGRLARQRIRQTLQENYRQRVDEMELGQELGPVAIGDIKILGDTGSARPFYMGPWDKSAKVVNGRRPFVKETSGEVDYDVDSSVEWEMNAALEDAEGEDLVSEEGSEEEEEEEEEGGDNDNSETEEMDGWLVDENVVVREAENNTSDSDEDDSDFDINKPIVPEELSDVESGYGSDFDMDIDQNEETIDEKLIRDLKQAKTFRNDGSDKYVIKPRRKHPKTVPVTRKKLVHLTTTVIGPVFDNSNDFLNDFAVVQFPKFRPAAPQKVPDVPVNTTNPVPVKKEPPPKFEFNKNAKRRISAIVSGSDLSLKILVEKIKQAYPMASKIQIQAYIQSNYQKFKKNASNKPRWHNSKIYNQASAKQNSSIGENDRNKKRKSSALLDDSGPRNTVPIIPICVKKDNGGENKNTKSSLYSYFSKS